MPHPLLGWTFGNQRSKSAFGANYKRVIELTSAINKAQSVIIVEKAIDLPSLLRTALLLRAYANSDLMAIIALAFTTTSFYRFATAASIMLWKSAVSNV
jgi:hypothetical protein